jgi:hypothetical protein
VRVGTDAYPWGFYDALEKACVPKVRVDCQTYDVPEWLYAFDQVYAARPYRFWGVFAEKVAEVQDAIRAGVDPDVVVSAAAFGGWEAVRAVLEAPKA